MTTSVAEASPVEQAAAYCAEVARHLGVLHEDERAELLEDLLAHLTDVAAEDTATPLVARLGPPEQYAAELLTAEGIAGAASMPPLPLRARLAASPLGSVGRRVGASRLGRAWWELRPVLVPAWLVARGYLVVSLIAAVSLGNTFPGFPVPRLFDNPLLGLAALLVAIPASVRWHASKTTGLWRWSTVAADVVLVIFAMVLLNHTGRTEIRYVDSGGSAAVSPGCLSDGAGSLITNLYPYDESGKLLSNVLLYDQNGGPIDNLCPVSDQRGRELRTRYAQDINNAPVVNVFPRQQQVIDFVQERPGESPVATTVPVRPPAVVVPKLAPTTTTTASPTTATTATPATTATTAPVSPSTPTTQPAAPATSVPVTSTGSSLRP